MSAETQAIIADIRSALIKAHALDGTPDPYMALATAEATVAAMIDAAQADKDADAAHVAGQGVLDAAAAGYPTP